MTRLMRVVVLFLSALTVVSLVSVLRAALPNVQTGQWAASGNLQQARSGAAAVLLPDGRILITGGDVAGAPATSVEVFNPDGSFSAAPPMSVARSGHAASLLATGDVLVTGGRTSGGGITNSAEVFDPTNSTWTAATAMQEARAGHTTAQLPDYSIVIVGGVSSSGPVSAVERYSFWDGTFVHAGVINHSRADAAVAVLGDGRVLVAGGATMDAQGQSTPSALVDIFDPANGVSADGPSLSSARAGASATTLLDGRVAVIGGNDGSADLASAEIYDPAAGAWSTIAAGTPRSQHLAVLLPSNNAVLLTGGTGAKATDLFVPWANSNAGAFQATAPSLVSHSNGVAVPLSEDGLLFAGTGDSGPATELYRFATVKTDQSDYAPGTTVTITGSGWKPGETVTLTLAETPLIDTHPAMTTVADGNGNIFNDQFSPDSHDIGILFYLTASGSASGLSAQTSFMDGNVKVNPQPGNATFTLTSTLFTASSNCTGASNAPVSQPVSGPTTFPAAAGQSILLQASATGTKNPSGTVTFGSWRSSDPFTFNPATPATICVAGFSGNGNQNYAANYDGLTKLAFTSAAINVNAGQCSSSLSVQSQDASNAGANPVVALTVGLSSTSGGGQFFQSTDATCSLAAISSVNIPTSSNTASFRYKDSNGGSPVITASAQGTTIASASQTETVTSTHNTTTSVNCTPNPVAVTVPTTCTASVTDTSVSGATSPGGSVSFASSGTGAFSSPGTSCTLSGAGATTSCSTQYTPALGSAGTPTITGNYGGDSTHNTSSGTFSLTVGKLTPAFSNLSSPTITYGAASTTLSGKISAGAQIPTGNVSITLNSVTQAAAIQSDGSFSSSFTASALTVISPGPTYSISYHFGGDANFSAVSPDGAGALTVSAVRVTATLTASDKTYDGANVATITGCSLTGVLAGDVANVNCSGSSATFASANAGTSPQTVTATVSLGGSAAGNYLLSSSTATTTAKINPKEVTANVTASDKTYDGTNAATITGCSLTGVLAGDAGNVNCSGSSATFASANASTSPQTVTATVSLGGSAAGNYLLSSSTATTTAKINPRPITVTADPQTKVYGTPDPALTYKVTSGSLVSGESFSGNLTRVAGENVLGSPYAIQQGTLTAGTNYALTFNTANFTITPAAASVTPTAASKIYGTADPVLSGTLSGFLATDNVTAVYSRTAGETVLGGPYTISATLSPAGVLSNYNITYNTANFTITPAAASVTPTAASKIYGTADPGLSGTLSGFLAADNVTAAYSRTAGETVLGGPYTISATLSPAGVLSNYNITYNTANFTITPAAASVTPTAASKIYGTADPGLTGTLSGFQVSDHVTATYSRSAGETVLGGPYTISATLSPAGVLSNYNITYNTANFTITPAATTVTVSPVGTVTLGQTTLPVTAVVSAVSPSTATVNEGNVTFRILQGSTVWASATSATVLGGASANLTVSALPVGSYTVQATYNPPTTGANFTGSSSTAGGSLVVQYNVCLLYDGTRSVKSGAAYPIKIYLCDVSSHDVSSSGIIVHAISVSMLSGWSGPPEDAGNANPDMDFRYDSGQGPSGGYMFNLKTTGLGSGTYSLNFTAGPDATIYKVPFGVK